MEKNIDIAENDAKQYIVVKIGSEQYGIDISYIDNIVLYAENHTCSKDPDIL